MASIIKVRRSGADAFHKHCIDSGNHVRTLVGRRIDAKAANSNEALILHTQCGLARPISCGNNLTWRLLQRYSVGITGNGPSAIPAHREHHGWCVRVSNATARKKVLQQLGQLRCNLTVFAWSRTTATGSKPSMRAARCGRANVSTRRGVQYRASSYSSPCRKILTTVGSLSESPGEKVQTGCKHSLRDFGCSK
jgi:hypothetical protein